MLPEYFEFSLPTKLIYGIGILTILFWKAASYRMLKIRYDLRSPGMSLTSNPKSVLAADFDQIADHEGTVPEDQKARNQIRQGVPCRKADGQPCNTQAGEKAGRVDPDGGQGIHIVTSDP